jgi:outer membrane immunogenic protein
MKKSFAAALVLALGLSTHAVAADMAVKAPPMVAAPVAYSWTRCYVGLNIGGGWSERTGDSGDHTPDFDRLFAATTVPTSLGTSSSGAIGGGQVGCNYQTGPVVFGLEADIQSSGIHGSSTVLRPANLGLDPSASTGDDRLDWFGTVRGRFGFLATPNLLLYGTGGLAYGRVKNSATLVFTPPIDGNYSGSTNETKSGWTAGAGAEYAFGNNWSAKVEYLYVDLGTTTVREFDPRNNPITVSSVDYRFRHRYQTVRFGLNYSFGAGPVVAKY